MGEKPDRPAPVFMASLHTPIFRGRVEGGRIYFDREDELKRQVMSLEGRRVELTLRREVKRRSPRQNRYYHGVVLKMLADGLGYGEPADLHHELKRRFLAVDPDAPFVKTRSTSELNAAEFEEYVEQVRQLAAEMSIYIPAPNEVSQ